MTGEDWGAGFSKSVAVFLNGQGIPDRDTRGQRITDDSFLLCFNAHYEDIEFTLPPAQFGEEWQTVIDTGANAPVEDAPPVKAATQLTVEARTTLILQAVTAAG
jgi:glycogen operon protein